VVDFLACVFQLPTMRIEASCRVEPPSRFLQLFEPRGTERKKRGVQSSVLNA